jgi:hypothetical protein
MHVTTFQKEQSFWALKRVKEQGRAAYVLPCFVLRHYPGADFELLYAPRQR